jgi:cyclopropane fatty-acyl-phospholipid synthase-like methyltransferase
MHPDVQTYYEQTRFDYRTIWNNRKNRAVHFGFYDEHASKHQDALANMNRAMADAVGIRPGDRVLDAGCGMGSACFWLAEYRQARATGISIVQSQIDDCNKEAMARQAAGTAFEYADFCDTPFADASFDVVWACESVCHSDRKSDFYREAFRLLRPGGRLIMADFIRKSRPVSSKGEKLLEAWLRPWAIPDLDTGQEHLDHARQAGFSQVECRDVTPSVRVSLRNLHELCRKWLPIGKVFRLFRIVNDVRLNNVRASICLYEALQEGAWYYGMVVAVK